MNVPAQRTDLPAAYREALGEFLEAPSEGALVEAYELGRRALAEGRGLIEWSIVHDGAVGALEVILRGPEALAQAASFFRESLSPFEMTQRGYAENNLWLERLNEELRGEVAAKERLAAQVQEANAELEAFSYSVAHDLRAPLRHITGFTGLLRADQQSQLSAEGARFVGRIVLATQRMSEIIEGLLVLARATKGDLAAEPVDLGAQARTIAASLAQSEPERKVTFEIADPLPAVGDGRLLGTVLENLLGNAWKFTKNAAAPRIEVGIDRQKQPPVYFVRDNGAGFDMAYANKLFGVFQRLHSQDAFPGTGIGLATVQRIIRRHGGRIWAEGKVDEGASFFFTLKS